MAYTKNMNAFAMPTPAPKPKTSRIRTVSLLLAAILVVMVVAQLFTYEEFANVIKGMWLPLPQWSPVRAAILVTLEVIALPFLLAMRLSPAMRVVSMVAGWLVAILWLGISLWINLNGAIVANSGFLGATIDLPVGWWNVLFCVSLGVLAGWASWGMWPLRRKK